MLTAASDIGRKYENRHPELTNNSKKAKGVRQIIQDQSGIDCSKRQKNVSKRLSALKHLKKRSLIQNEQMKDISGVQTAENDAIKRLSAPKDLKNKKKGV